MDGTVVVCAFGGGGGGIAEKSMQISLRRMFRCTCWVNQVFVCVWGQGVVPEVATPLEGVAILFAHGHSWHCCPHLQQQMITVSNGRCSLFPLWALRFQDYNNTTWCNLKGGRHSAKQADFGNLYINVVFPPGASQGVYFARESVPAFPRKYCEA